MSLWSWGSFVVKALDWHTEDMGFIPILVEYVKSFLVSASEVWLENCSKWRLNQTPDYAAVFDKVKQRAVFLQQPCSCIGKFALWDSFSLEYSRIETIASKEKNYFALSIFILAPAQVKWSASFVLMNMYIYWRTFVYVIEFILVIKSGTAETGILPPSLTSADRISRPLRRHCR